MGGGDLPHSVCEQLSLNRKHEEQNGELILENNEDVRNTEVANLRKEIVRQRKEIDKLQAENESLAKENKVLCDLYWMFYPSVVIFLSAAFQDMYWFIVDQVADTCTKILSDNQDVHKNRINSLEVCTMQDSHQTQTEDDTSNPSDKDALKEKRSCFDKQVNDTEEENRKLFKDIESLKVALKKQSAENETLRQEVEKSKDTLETNARLITDIFQTTEKAQLKLEANKRNPLKECTSESMAEATRYIEKINKKLTEMEVELKTKQKELDNAKNRLSKVMGQKLTDNNPNVADLSDVNRPTKLAEKYTELYDNQWTDAFEKINNGDDRKTIEFLKFILLDIMSFCKEKTREQMEQIQSSILIDTQENAELMPALIMKQLKDCRKTMAHHAIRKMFEDYLNSLRRSGNSFVDSALTVLPYTKECFELCWLMCVQDPPVVIRDDTRPGEKFDTGIYKTYTHTGPKLDYIVWPALLLHQGGPLLCKGVAQGC